MGPVLARPLLAPLDEESAPMGDGEGGEDESMQEGAEEGRRPFFRRSENQPSSQEVQERMKTHVPYRSGCALCVKGRGRNDPHRSGGRRSEDQEIIHISQLTTDSPRRITLMLRQIMGATRFLWELRRSIGSLWRWQFR